MTSDAPLDTAPDLATEPSSAPWVPPGQDVEIPGVGTTFVRDSGGPPGAPAVLLLHGWAVTADLNFFTTYPGLAERYRIITLDHRGHGRGIRPANGIVRLSDCADDAAAVLDALDVHSATVMGYSMGGAIAQLLWRRHPERVGGLVLGSTSRNFRATPLAGLTYRTYTLLARAAHAVPAPAEAVVKWRIDRRVSSEDRGEWMRAELERASPAGILSAMRSIGRFTSNRWIGEIDVPSAVVITTKDRTIPPRFQQRLAESIPGSVTFEVPGPHDSIVTRPDQYLPALDAALSAVAQRQ
jgi:3-oxoadipate enol-lactonase